MPAGAWEVVGIETLLELVSIKKKLILAALHSITLYTLYRYPPDVPAHTWAETPTSAAALPAPDAFALALSWLMAPSHRRVQAAARKTSGTARLGARSP